MMGATMAAVGRAEDRKFKETAESISLHGLGFLQVKLQGKQRLHVWHPDLPRRRCFEHSAVHDHRFAFSSTVLVGTQINVLWGGLEIVYSTSGLTLRNAAMAKRAGATHAAYKHEGERSKFGNRPWLHDGYLAIGAIDKQMVEAGETYHMRPYVFHSTMPGGDGRVATIMTKTFEGDVGARSLCAVGIMPDVDFDRKQMSEDDMWAVVREVLSLG